MASKLKVLANGYSAHDVENFPVDCCYGNGTTTAFTDWGLDLPDHLTVSPLRGRSEFYRAGRVKANHNTLIFVSVSLGE